MHITHLFSSSSSQENIRGVISFQRDSVTILNKRSTFPTLGRVTSTGWVFFIYPPTDIRSILSICVWPTAWACCQHIREMSACPSNNESQEGNQIWMDPLSQLFHTQRVHREESIKHSFDWFLSLFFIFIFKLMIKSFPEWTTWRIADQSSIPASMRAATTNKHSRQRTVIYYQK